MKLVENDTQTSQTCIIQHKYSKVGATTSQLSTIVVSTTNLISKVGATTTTELTSKATNE
jgi:hypothetical protein